MLRPSPGQRKRRYYTSPKTQQRREFYSSSPRHRGQRSGFWFVLVAPVFVFFVAMQVYASRHLAHHYQHRRLDGAAAARARRHQDVADPLPRMRARPAQHVHPNPALLPRPPQRTKWVVDSRAEQPPPAATRGPPRLDDLRVAAATIPSAAATSPSPSSLREQELVRRRAVAWEAYKARLAAEREKMQKKKRTKRKKRVATPAHRIVYNRVGNSGSTMLRMALDNVPECESHVVTNTFAPSGLSNKSVAAIERHFRDARRGRCVVAHGHFKFTPFPEISSLVYMTMIRDPVARWLSIYDWYDRKCVKTESEWCESTAHPGMLTRFRQARYVSPEDCIDDALRRSEKASTPLEWCTLATDRTIMHYFRGRGDESRSCKGLVDRTLRRYAFIGILEDCERSIRRLNAVQSALTLDPSICAERQNVAGQDEHVARTLDSKRSARLRKELACDYALYNRVRGLGLGNGPSPPPPPPPPPPKMGKKKLTPNEAMAQEKTGNTDITLLLSYFATTHPHGQEVEAALLANLMNEVGFREICLVYDQQPTPQQGEIAATTTATTNASAGAAAAGKHDCAALRRRLAMRGEEMYSDWSSERHLGRLTCIDRQLPQPSYREMFEFAFSLPLKGGVVVLSNADVVFDATIARMRKIRRNKLTVLTVTGGPKDSPPEVRRFYPGEPQHLPSLCGGWVWTKEHRRVPARASCSWDAHVFRRDSVVNLAAARPYFLDNRTKKEYTMNTMGAENAAAMAISESGLHSESGNRWALTDACAYVNLWHFHQTPKQHRNLKTADGQDVPFGGRVQRASTYGGIVGMCAGNHCLGNFAADCLELAGGFLEDAPGVPTWSKKSRVSYETTMRFRYTPRSRGLIKALWSESGYEPVKHRTRGEDEAIFW